MTKRPNLCALLALTTMLLACSARDTENEARLFIERYDAVIRGGDENREARLASLAELPLLDDEVRRVRDRCVELQRALVRAQSLTAEARARVEVVEDAGIVAEAERRAIEDLLARAAAAKDTVERGMHACADGVSRLKAHHARRH